MRSLIHLYRFLKPYRIQAGIALVLLFGMVAADLAIPYLNWRPQWANGPEKHSGATRGGIWET